MPIKIKYDTSGLIAALEPGLCALIVGSFEDKLSKKINRLIDEVYEEMKKEIPQKVSVAVDSVVSPLDRMGDRIHVVVNLTDDRKKKEA